jgi:DNA-binding transcriptional regulator YiaG
MTPSEFRTLRKSMGHTQHTLAEALLMGKSGHQTVSDWERGLRPIPGPVQIAMEHLANCPRNI